MLELDKIYCMDALKGLQSIDDNTIDLVLTDPPYGFNDKDWDTFNDKELMVFNISWVKEVYRILKNEGSFYCFSGFRNMNVFLKTFDLFPFNLQNMIVWERDSPGRLQGSKKYTMNFELIWFLTKSNDYIFNVDDVRIKHKYKDKRQNPNGKNCGCIWSCKNLLIGKHKEQVGHPHQKPIELIERIVKASSNEDDIVLDLFSGSGTTPLVCKRINRRYIAFEKEEGYYNISLKRLLNQPERIDKWIET